jgi:hypothetical protein
VGRRLLRLGRAAAAHQAEDRQRVDAEDPARHQRDHHRAETEAAAAEPKTPAPADITGIFDVAALAIAFPFHAVSSARCQAS